MRRVLLLTPISFTRATTCARTPPLMMNAVGSKRTMIVVRNTVTPSSSDTSNSDFDRQPPSSGIPEITHKTIVRNPKLASTHEALKPEYTWSPDEILTSAQTQEEQTSEQQQQSPPSTRRRGRKRQAKTTKKHDQEDAAIIARAY